MIYLIFKIAVFCIFVYICICLVSLYQSGFDIFISKQKSRDKKTCTKCNKEIISNKCETCESKTSNNRVSDYMYEN